MNQTAALVPTGIITVCCGLHLLPPASCCDTLDCGPCCPECPTCPEVAQKTPERRRAEARAMREFTAELIVMHRATIRAVEATTRFLDMSDDEIAIRTAPCSGCAGTSLVHTLDYRCDWNGLPQEQTTQPSCTCDQQSMCPIHWPPDPICTCDEDAAYQVCDIHIWVGGAAFDESGANNG